MTRSNKSWEKIFSDYKILEHDFKESPFPLSASMIKTACQNFKKTTEKEVRILCKQDDKESVPDIMKDNGLFLLPVRNGQYIIVKGYGYIDIPEIKEETTYQPQILFPLDTPKVGNSEMQHLDFAYAVSIIRTFLNDDSLILTIRGRKYTPKFSFFIEKQEVTVESVQTEVDAGYEGRDKVVLVEAKNSKTSNTIIRQLYYPYRQWSQYTEKKIYCLFFEKRKNEYMIWQFAFKNEKNYNSIYLVKAKKYIV